MRSVAFLAVSGFFLSVWAGEIDREAIVIPKPKESGVSYRIDRGEKDEGKPRTVTVKMNGGIVTMPLSRYEKLKARLEKEKKVEKRVGPEEVEVKELKPEDTPEYKRVERKLKEGFAELRRKDYSDALRIFKDVVEEAPAVAEELKEKASAEIEKIEALAEKVLATADSLYEKGKILQSAKKYREITLSFRGTSAGDRAVGLLSKLNSDPEIAPYLELDTAFDLEKGKNYRKAFELYEIVTRKYPETEFAEIARRRSELLLKSGVLEGAELGEEELREANGWLTIARIHIANNRLEEAGMWLERIVEKYNGSTVADKAGDLLTSIKESE